MHFSRFYGHGVQSVQSHNQTTRKEIKNENYIESASLSSYVFITDYI